MHGSKAASGLDAIELTGPPGRAGAEMAVSPKRQIGTLGTPRDEVRTPTKMEVLKV